MQARPMYDFPQAVQVGLSEAALQALASSVWKRSCCSQRASQQLPCYLQCCNLRIAMKLDRATTHKQASPASCSLFSRSPTRDLRPSCCFLSSVTCLFRVSTCSWYDLRSLHSTQH